RAGDNLGRATRGAALGILGRSYMQAGNLSAAKTALEAVVNLNKYELNENFYTTFEEENDFTPESIFEVVYAPIGDYNWNAGTGDGTNAKSVRAQEYGLSWRNVTPASNIINAFENEIAGDAFTDPRLGLTAIFEGESYAGGTETMTINANGPMMDYHGEQRFVNWYKYSVYYKENPGGYRTTTTNFIVMRYADVLLLLAEIEAREGDLGAARAYINQIRDRVGIPNIEDSRIPSGTQDEVLMAVVHEREVELASEQVRGRDLKRWHEAGLLNMGDFKSCFTEKDLLFPVPLQELITNPNINQEDQNPGYN
ncbi:MAG: RagB/SusD family nutrient uptake outer membrane protein, partial [Bacteroidota bacterium]